MPTLAKEPPAGPGWVHEVKFDGYRCQLHKDGKEVTLYSKNGNDFTRKFPSLGMAAASIPIKSLILDCEIVATAQDGRPDFNALLYKRHDALTLWVFDILAKGVTDLRSKTLSERCSILASVMQRVEHPMIRMSDWFADPHQLLSACATHKLEGIVSKRLDQPYVSGKSRDWIKVKCPQWRESNQWRHDFFARQNGA